MGIKANSETFSLLIYRAHTTTLYADWAYAKSG